MPVVRRILGPLTIASVLPLACAATAAAAPRQQAPASSAAASPSGVASRDALRDHIDAVDDILDGLLDWRHVDTNEPTLGDTARQSTTLISVEASRIERLDSGLAAIAAAMPSNTPNTASQSTGTAMRGDLRAHVEKARNIVQELKGPGRDTASAVGTSGAAEGSQPWLLTIDRTALQRLEIEIDAIKLLSRKR